MARRENEAQSACLRVLAMLGVMHWRNNTGVARLPGRGGRIRPVMYGCVGSPDILGVLPGGRALGVECKSDTGQQSDHQRAWQERFEAAGGCYLLVRSGAELVEHLKLLGVGT